jgi:hypothetical protein
MLKTLVLGLVIMITVILALGHNISVVAQNVTNTSNLTGIENTTTSASVTARQIVSPPELDPEDYPTPSPTDN